MDNKYILYKTDGTEEVVVPSVMKTQFVTEELRCMIGGSIQLLDLGAKAFAYMGERYCGFRDKNGLTSADMRGGLVRDRWVLVVNDNGLNEKLPTNEEASTQWGARLVGNVLLCRRSAIR